MLRTYLLISNIDRASLTRPFPYFRTCGLIVRSSYLLTLYVHNRLCHQPTHILHAYVKPLLALCKYLIHLIHYPLPPASLLYPPYCFLPLPCGNFHLWLLSFCFALPWIMPRGSHSFKFQLNIVYPLRTRKQPNQSRVCEVTHALSP